MMANLVHPCLSVLSRDIRLTQARRVPAARGLGGGAARPGVLRSGDRLDLLAGRGATLGQRLRYAWCAAGGRISHHLGHGVGLSRSLDRPVAAVRRQQLLPGDTYPGRLRAHAGPSPALRAGVCIDRQSGAGDPGCPAGDGRAVRRVDVRVAAPLGSYGGGGAVRRLRLRVLSGALFDGSRLAAGGDAVSAVGDRLFRSSPRPRAAARCRFACSVVQLADAFLVLPGVHRRDHRWAVCRRQPGLSALELHPRPLAAGLGRTCLGGGGDGRERAALHGPRSAGRDPGTGRGIARQLFGVAVGDLRDASAFRAFRADRAGLHRMGSGAPVPRRAVGRLAQSSQPVRACIGAALVCCDVPAGARSLRANRRLADPVALQMGSRHRSRLRIDASAAAIYVRLRGRDCGALRARPTGGPVGTAVAGAKALDGLLHRRVSGTDLARLRALPVPPPATSGRRPGRIAKCVREARRAQPRAGARAADGNSR